MNQSQNTYKSVTICIITNGGHVCFGCPRMCNANRVRLSFRIARSNLARSGIARSDLVATHAYRLD